MAKAPFSEEEYCKELNLKAMFEEELCIKSVLMGFGLDSDAIHSPNEHYGVFNYLKGIQTIPCFDQNLVEVS